MSSPIYCQMWKAHISMMIGSTGTLCNDLAPVSVMTVNAPNCSPIRSSGVMGWGWMTIILFFSNRRPSGGGLDGFKRQY